MRHQWIISVAVTALIIAWGSCAYADTVYLKNGRSFECQVVQQDDDHVWIQQSADTIKLKFSKDRVERIVIDKQAPNATGSSEGRVRGVIADFLNQSRPHRVQETAVTLLRQMQDDPSRRGVARLPAVAIIMVLAVFLSTVMLSTGVIWLLSWCVGGVHSFWSCLGMLLRLGLVTLGLVVGTEALTRQLLLPVSPLIAMGVLVASRVLVLVIALGMVRSWLGISMWKALFLVTIFWICSAVALGGMSMFALSVLTLWYAR